MLHDIDTHSRIARERSRRTGLTRRGDTRQNPWLLWRPERPEPPERLTVAELAECRCPDLCDRDHVNE